MRRMKKARQYLLGIFAALLLCGIFSVNTVKADTQYVYDNASLLSDEEEQDLERSCAEFESNTDIHMVILTEYSSGSEDCQAIAMISMIKSIRRSRTASAFSSIWDSARL